MKKAKIGHIVKWYYGNFCARCGNIDDKNKNYGRDCWNKLQLLKEKLKGDMTHKEFVRLVRQHPTFCKPVPRKFRDCPICMMLGIK